jgi:hypothetical protein
LSLVSEFDEYEELGLITTIEESQASFADDDNNECEDLYDEIEAVNVLNDEVDANMPTPKPLKKLSQVVPAMKDLSSDESSDKQGTYSFFTWVMLSEVLGSQLHIQYQIPSHEGWCHDPHTMTLSIILYELHQKITSLLNIDPESLQLQYYFSINTKNSISYDLTTHTQGVRVLHDYCVPPKLSNGK